MAPGDTNNVYVDLNNTGTLASAAGSLRSGGGLQGVAASLAGGGGSTVMRLTGPGRLGIQSMFMEHKSE